MFLPPVSSSFVPNDIGDFETASNFKRQLRVNRRAFNRDFLQNPLYQTFSNYHRFYEVPKEKSSNRIYPNIDMDAYSFIDAEKGELATVGVYSCMAICIRAKTPNGKIYLGLAHVSSLYPLEKVLSSMYFSMIQKVEPDSEIEIAILGGKIITEDKELPDNFEVMRDALVIAESCQKSGIPVKGVRFNSSLDHKSGWDVLLTAEKIYFSTHSFFHIDCNEENGGIPVGELIDEYFSV